MSHMANRKPFGQTRGPVRRNDGKIFPSAAEAAADCGVSVGAMRKAMRCGDPVHGWMFAWRDQPSPHVDIRAKKRRRQQEQ